MAVNDKVQNGNNNDCWKKWTTEELYDELCSRNLKSQAELLKKEKIRGDQLNWLHEERLRKIFCDKPYSEIIDFLNFLKEIDCFHAVDNNVEFKVFNDPIHGHIEIHPLCVNIIDTPQFQRLRHIKQLGGAYHVFPGASHNRFEHSIGVCHLAGELVARLQRQQPELGITEVDKLCVEIAGLCHDLGHGPFSHLFDGMFIAEVNPSRKWGHEEASVDMFDYMVKVNKLEEMFEKYDIKEDDITFIKEQIQGPSKDVYKGRSNKEYLYEIVSNKTNGVDVDKWDYFARDGYMLGIRNNFDHIRLMRFCRVVEGEDKKQHICFRDKEVENLYDMFYTRKTLHSRAYQHPVSQAVEMMINDALKIADQCEKFKITVKGKDYSLQECIDNMEAYEKLDDSILHKIMWSTEHELEGARKLVDRINKRNLYRCIGSTPYEEKKVDKEKILEEINREVSILEAKQDIKEEDKLKSDQLALKVVKYNYGMKDLDPVQSIKFYTKSNPNKCDTLPKKQVSKMLPEEFQETIIRVYCKVQKKATVENAQEAFKKWCQNNNLIPMIERFTPTPAKLSGMRTREDSDPQAIDAAKKNLFLEK